ncbi:MAG: hypothetical protein IIX52_00525 [Paludibacteraceae bacterium]|nr:hypothetical protein [Paludibacteraceae bacterium]
MSKTLMKNLLKVSIFSLIAYIALSCNSNNTSEYVDLGLPSGTLWKNQNEKGYYSWDKAKSEFADKIPTRDQIEELKIFCTWEWTGKGVKVIGANGNYIYLPAGGYRSYFGGMEGVGSEGSYWSSSSSPSTVGDFDFDFSYGRGMANFLFFSHGGVGIYGGNMGDERSVRLVQDN